MDNEITNEYKENPCLYCGVLLAEKEKLICPYCEKRKEYERFVGNGAD